MVKKEKERMNMVVFVKFREIPETEADKKIRKSLKISKIKKLEGSK